MHGYTNNRTIWSGLADSLARTHRVIAVDTRGFGKSGKPVGAANYGRAMVDDLVALLDTLGVQRAHVVGYSMGAMLAAVMALTYPERVGTVTLVAGAFLKDSAAIGTWVKPWVDDLEQGKRLTTIVNDVIPAAPDSQKRAMSDAIFLANDSAALTDVLKSFPSLALDWDRVAASTVPALVIVGMDDAIRSYSVEIAQRWPNATLVEVPAADHMKILAAPRLPRNIRRTAHRRGA